MCDRMVAGFPIETAGKRSFVTRPTKTYPLDPGMAIASPASQPFRQVLTQTVHPLVTAQPNHGHLVHFAIGGGEPGVRCDCDGEWV